jgi:hypothetical protein
MINKKEFKKMAKNILRSDKNNINPKLMHPTRDWEIGMIIGLVIIVVTAAWSANTYLSYRGTSTISGTQTEAEPVVYRESLVQAALQEYETRSEESQAEEVAPNSTTTDEVIDEDPGESPSEATNPSTTEAATTSEGEINNQDESTDTESLEPPEIFDGINALRSE